MSFGVALHTALALAYNEGRHLPSSAIAFSIGANAVTVRRVIGQLAAAGLVKTQPGPGGGAQLARSPARITVADIYDAIGSPGFVHGHGKDPNEACEVSVCMPRVFDRLNDAIGAQARLVLRATTLETLLQEELAT